jgi:hypothetical protein
MYFEIADGRRDYFDRIPYWPKDTVNLTLEAPRTTTLATAHSWMEETRLDEQAIAAVGNRRLRSASLDSDHRTHPRSLARYMARRDTRRGKTDRKAAPVTVLRAFAVLVGIFVAWGLARAGRTAGTFDRAFPFGYTLPTLTADETGLANQFWNELLENEKAQPALRLCLKAEIGERSGLDHVIEAIRLLPPEAKARVQLVICGVDLRGATAKFGSDPAIVYAGWVDQPMLITLMERSDLGVIPYRNTIDFQVSWKGQRRPCGSSITGAIPG